MSNAPYSETTFQVELKSSTLSIFYSLRNMLLGPHQNFKQSSRSNISPYLCFNSLHSKGIYIIHI
jgi:hypothetical protein